jgi:hypothetical protein
MNSKRNKQRLIEAWQSLRSRDAARIAALFTRDAEWIAPERNATARMLDGRQHESHASLSLAVVVRAGSCDL